MYLQENAFDIVVIGSSLGGADVLCSILSILPECFPAPVAIVNHLSSSSPGYLAGAMGRRSRVPVQYARQGDALEPSRVYLAPRGCHFRIDWERRCELLAGERVNYARPAIDPLFVSAAEVFGPRALAVVLSGRLWDGAIGSARIRLADGVVLAQDPDTCLAPDMPRAAIAAGADFILPADRIGPALVSLVTNPGVAALFGVGRHRRAA